MGNWTVVSIVPLDIHEEKPGMSPSYYDIPASDGREPKVLVIEDGVTFVYLDEKRGSLEKPVFAKEIANAVVNDYVRAHICYRPQERPEASPGVFCVEGEWTPEQVKNNFSAQLDKAFKEQVAWFEELVKIADDDWAKTHQHKTITRIQRLAALNLGLKREWLFAPEQQKMTNCKFCTSQIRIDAIICPTCRQILHQDKYDTLLKGAPIEQILEPVVSRSTKDIIREHLNGKLEKEK